MISALLLAAAIQGPPAPDVRCWDYSQPDGSAIKVCQATADAAPVLSYKPATDLGPVTKRQANRLANQLAVVGIAFAADLLTTGWALARCSGCSEGNFLGPNPESRLALKIGGAVALGWGIWKAESADKHDVALGLTVGATGVSAVAVGNNVYHAIKGH